MSGLTKVKLGPIDEIHLSVKDLETMRDFYLSVVGFEEEFYHPGEMLGLKTGGTSLALTVAEQGASGVGIVLACDDVDAAVAALEEAGVTITERPWDGHWGGRVAAFKDPEGNTIYLEQPVRLEN
jgi:predicted enzyme related to lactoylglutathione lyase